MRENIWRFQYYKNYKKTRDERLTTFNGDIFKYCYNNLLPTLEEKLGIQSCEHPISEADDIIAVFTRYLHNNNHLSNITIVTNDNDYLQLIRDNVKIVNMKNVNLNTRLIEDADTYLKIKIILGDKSDNIPSVFPKCGEKKAIQLAQNPVLLEEKMKKYPGSKEKYELNTLLIDTKCIPEYIQKEILDMLKID
jgi:5'-3' exonuclease